MQLSHEKLDVYQKSIQFLAIAMSVIDSLPRGNATLADQFRRAALSVPLNIAEASGRTGIADNARHFAISRGSALECAAIIDACKVMGFIDQTIFQRAKTLLFAIVAMLSKLSRPKFSLKDQDKVHDIDHDQWYGPAPLKSGFN